jgi:endonuclease/exonuclease/phosphatase family metal-dependent hydrolase
MIKYSSLTVIFAFCCIFLLFFHPGRGKVADSLTVITYNMGTISGNLPDIDKVVDVLSCKSTPDVVLLQEVPSLKVARDIGSKMGLPFSIFSTYKPGVRYGLAVLARYPLSASKILEQDGYASFAARMDFMGAPFLLCSVHLVRIKPLSVQKEEAIVSWREFFQILHSEVIKDNARSRAVEKILPWLNSDSVERTTVSGDFNTFPFSRAVRKMTAAYDDCLWPSLNYLTASYPKLTFPVKPRIDNIFHSSNLVCNAAAVIKESAGDHYPVWAEIGIKGNAKTQRR